MIATSRTWDDVLDSLLVFLFFFAVAVVWAACLKLCCRCRFEPEFAEEEEKSAYDGGGGGGRDATE